MDLQAMSAFNYKKRGECCAEVAAAGDRVALADHHLGVRFAVTYYSAVPAPARRASWSLMNSALACDCIDNGYMGSKERVQEFTVTTINDFDAQHLANDTLNDLLQIQLSPTDIRDLTTHLKNDTSRTRNIGSSYTLRLKKKPALNPEFRVRVKVRLDNGETYSSDTTPVVLQ
ncbi:hypothetical protein LJY25_02320 [Hymenobacter sp. BT175]|uniref:hypothetical protein n=1 Tax=Hymenobacter translucens TaxID=2886507 RepID=UPI001D0E2768|nr:hypothetical protein [Hymenobacter translucens]MCC2545265.1 hypothetical protein [Hymenobacter translucens]